MKKLIVTVLIVVSVPRGNMAIAQSDGCKAAFAQVKGCKEDIQFPGAFLKWLKIAEPVFRREGLNLDKYNIVFLDDPDSVTVLLRSTDATCIGYGSTGSRPDFEVAISKKSKKVMHSNYER